MKIALFIPSLRGGGAERVWVTLANEFAKRGYDVDLLLAEKAGPYLELVSDQVNIVDFQKGRVLASLFPLVRYLKKNKPAVLLSAMNHVNLVAIWSSLIARTKTKVIVSIRYSMIKTGSLMDIIHYTFTRFLVKLFFRFSYAITTVSEGVTKKTISIIPKQRHKIFTIYNPIIDHTFTELINQPVDHPWLTNSEKPNKPYLIVSAGSLKPVKGFDSLLNSFFIVRQNVNAKLIILGEGPMRPTLEKYITNLNLSEDVDLPGFVKNPFAYMKKSDLFVLSSKSEGLPGALIQAMACDTPVVSTDCPFGPSEILEEGKWGKLVPVDDARSMAEAIIDTLNANEQPDVVKRANFFSVEKCVNEYLNIIGV